MKDYTPQNMVMGLQHMFVMFGATVLVPLLTGLNIGATLLATGIGTLLFHFLTKNKVPIYLGSSFAFIPAIVLIAKNGSMAEALGGIFAAGIMYILVSIIFMFLDHNLMHKILPPHVTGPMIVLIGLILAPVAVNNANGTNVPHILETISVNQCWFIAMFTFGVSIFVKLFFEKIGQKFLSMLPVLFALAAGYILSIIMGIVDLTPVKEAAWIGLPDFTFPKFTTNAISLMVPIAIVAIVEHFGDVLAIGNVVNKDFIKDPGIHRTLLGDGIATLISASIGGPVLTTYSENTGAVALTGNHNPLVMRIAAMFAIILSFIPKFTVFIQSIPAPVIGGISILLFGMISSIGIKNMIDHKVDFTDPKVLTISATMLVLGLGGAQFHFKSIQLEGLGLAAIVGVVLNLILFGNKMINKK